jgi:uncharacterized protein YggU (UPF0235/DUF167 family)
VPSEILEFGNSLKLSFIAPPLDCRANEACIEFFANLLKVPRSSVTIASGQTNRRKVIRVTGLTTKQVVQHQGVSAKNRASDRRS